VSVEKKISDLTAVPALLTSAAFEIEQSAASFQVTFATMNTLFLSLNNTFVGFQTFTPDATREGINVGAIAVDPSAPVNGGIWYDSALNKFRARENGANVNLIGITSPEFADDVFRIIGSADATKKLAFEVDVITTATTRTITVLNEDLTIVGLTNVQTLVGKTLTTPTIGDFTNATHDHSNAAGGGTLLSTSALSDTASIAYLNTPNAYIAGNKQSFVSDTTNAAININSQTPSTTIAGDIWRLVDNIVYRNNADTADIIIATDTNTLTLLNKTLTTPTITSFVNATHDHQATAGGGTLLSTAALSDTANIAYLNTANVYTAGTRQDFLGLLAGTAGLNVGAIAGNPTTQVDGDIWYNSSSNTMFGRVNGANVDLGAAGGGGPEFADNVFRVIGSVDATKKLAFEVDGLTTATTRTVTMIDENLTIVGLTNAQTITTKTIAFGSNTVSGTKAEFDTALTDDNFAFVGTSNTWTANQIFNDNVKLLLGTGSDFEIYFDATNAQLNIPTGAIYVVAINNVDEYSFSNTALDIKGNDIDNIHILIRDQAGSGTDIDFGEEEQQTISIAANTTFTGTGYAIGKSKTVFITTDSTLRTLTFPAGWIFMGAKPADQAASKVGVLTLTCTTAAEAGVRAAYAVEA